MATKQYTVEQVKFVQQLMQMEPISLNTPIGDEKNSSIGDFIQDTTIPDLVDVVAQRMIKDRLNEAISTLTPREEKIIKLRYGLDDNNPRTLEDVGTFFTVTRERIRQIEAKALRKLRHPSRNKKLYWE